MSKLRVIALLATLASFSARALADTGVESSGPIEWLMPAVGEPAGIAVRQDGTILVSDRARGAIVAILPDARTRPVVTGLWKPWGVAVDAEERILVAEEYGRLLRVGTDGRIETLATRLHRPRWIAGDRDVVFASAAGMRYPHTGLAGEASPIGQLVLRRTPAGLVLPVADGFVEAPAVAVSGDALYAIGQSVGTTSNPGPTLAVRVPLGGEGEPGVPAVVASAMVHAPAGLTIDRLGALFFVAHPEAATPTVSVFKLLADGRLVSFASGLPAARSLAIEPEGHLLVAVPGTPPALLRFRAPAAAHVSAPAATQAASTTITGTAEPGSAVAVHRTGDGGGLLAVADVDTGGHFAVAVPLDPNTTNPIGVTVVGAGGAGLAGPAVSLVIVHDDRPPVVSLRPETASPLRGTVELTAEAHDVGSGLRAVTVYADARVLGLAENAAPAGALAVSARLDTLALGDGAHTIRVVAEDHAGNSAVHETTIIVENVPAPSAIAVAADQIRTIRAAVAALLRAGQCSWGTSCLGWASDGFHGVGVLIERGHLGREYGGNINPWGGPYGVIGGIDAYAVKVHGLPPGPAGDAACRDLAAALTGQARSTSCWGGWDQKLFEAGFPNP